MRGHLIHLRGDSQRALARSLIDAAPADAVVRIEPPTRTLDQNAKMQAMLGDVSRAKPEGRRHTPDVWKAVFMNACGHDVQFETGLNGEPFPIGFRSSRLSVAQMSDLIEFIAEYGARHRVRWSNEPQDMEGGQ